MKILYLIILTLFTQTVFSEVTNIGIEESSKKDVVAVFPFIDKANLFYDDGIRVQKIINDELLSLKRIEVVSIDDINIYLNSLDADITSFTDDEIIEIGRDFGYDKIVFGNIVKIGSRYNMNTRRYYVEPFERDFYYSVPSAYIKIELKILNVSTGKIEDYTSISGISSMSISSRYGFISFNYILASAYSDLAKNIRYKLNKLFKFAVEIGDVPNKKNVQVLSGTEYGVKKGQRFKVYRKEDYMSEDSLGIKPIGTIKIKSSDEYYSSARVLRGSSIKEGDIAQHFIFNNITFGLFTTYSAYKLIPYKESIPSLIGSAKMNIDARSLDLDYSFGLHFKLAYDTEYFAPGLSIGILFGDAFKTTWGIDTRINLEVKIPVYYDIINISIIPYFSFVSTFSEIGIVDGGEYFQSSFGYIRGGAKIHSNDIFFGGGILANIIYNITDNFGLTLGAGYKIYSSGLNIVTYASSYYGDIHFVLENNPELIDLTGLEVIVSVNFTF